MLYKIKYIVAHDEQVAHAKHRMPWRMPRGVDCLDPAGQVVAEIKEMQVQPVSLGHLLDLCFLLPGHSHPSLELLFRHKHLCHWKHGPPTVQQSADMVTMQMGQINKAYVSRRQSHKTEQVEQATVFRAEPRVEEDAHPFRFHEEHAHRRGDAAAQAEAVDEFRVGPGEEAGRLRRSPVLDPRHFHVADFERPGLRGQGREPRRVARRLRHARAALGRADVAA